MDVLAFTRAKHLVECHFDSPESLDELWHVKQYYQSQLAFTTSELQSATAEHDEYIIGTRRVVMCKVDEVKRVRRDVNRLVKDLICCQRQSASLRLPHTRQLGDARENIQKTLHTVDHFSTIHSEVFRLRQEMGASKGSITCVCRQILALEGMVYQLLREATVERENERDIDSCAQLEVVPEIATVPECHCPLFHAIHSSNAPKCMRLMQGHVGAVFSISQELRLHIQSVLSNCIEVGQDTPDILIQAVESMVLIEQSDLLHCGTMPSASSETFQQQTIRLIAKAFADHIQSNFAAFIYREADEGKSGIDVILGAATCALTDLIVLAREVTPCFPDDFGLNEIYQKQCEIYMFPQITALYCQSLSTLEVRDILTLIAWIEHYETQLSLLKPALQLAGELVTSAAELNREYLLRVKGQTMAWLRNIKERQRSIFADSDGHLITSDPEDILHLIDMQLAVADDHFPFSSYSSNVLGVCMEAVVNALDEMEVDIDIHWVTVGVEALCSYVNDCVRLSDKIETLSDRFGHGEESSSGSRSIVGQVCNRCIEVAQHVIKRISDYIMLDVKDQYLASIGTQEWENGGNMVAVVVQTLQDYFEDLNVWLPSFFLYKIVRRCFDLTLRGYIESFYCGLHSKKPPRHPSTASQIMKGDHTLLLQSFDLIFASFLEGSRLEKETRELEGRLAIISSMSNLLLSHDPDGAKNDVEVLLLELGHEAGTDAVLNIVAIQSGFNADGLESWVALIARQKELKNEGTATPRKYKVPTCVFATENASGGSKGSASEGPKSLRAKLGKKRSLRGNWTVGTPMPRRLKEWSKGAAAVTVKKRLSF